MSSKSGYVDNGWPQLPEGEHAVSEFAATVAGALSPFGETEFPLDPAKLPYVHANTTVNR